MYTRKRLIHILLTLAAIAAVFVLETFTALDLWVQNHFYDFGLGEWLINRQDHQQLKAYFYGGAKRALAALGGVALLVLLLGLIKPKLARFIRPSMLLVLCLIFVPLIVGTGKKVSNIYCPKEITEYGGKYEYQRVLECPRGKNVDMRSGDCFPAGHASGGFALLALYFCLPGRWRWLGLGIGLGAGWVMGNYQMIRGEHFISHTITTMLVAWLVILLIVPQVDKFMTFYKQKRGLD